MVFFFINYIFCDFQVFYDLVRQINKTAPSRRTKSKEESEGCLSGCQILWDNVFIAAILHEDFVLVNKKIKLWNKFRLRLKTLKNMRNQLYDSTVQYCQIWLLPLFAKYWVLWILAETLCDWLQRSHWWLVVPGYATQSWHIKRFLSLCVWKDAPANLDLLV